VIVAIAIPTLIPLLVLGKERHSEQEHAEKGITFGEMWRYLKSNRYLLIALLAMLIAGIASVESVIMIYVARLCFGNESFAAIMGLIAILPVIVAALLVPKLAKKFDKFHIFAAGYLIYIVLSVAAFFVGPTHTAAILVILSFRGIGTACYSVITSLFIADCVEYGAYKTGVRAAGISFSLQTFVSKIKSASLSSVVLFSLSFLGFVSGENAVQPAGVAEGVWSVFIFLPACGFLVALVVMALFYKLRDESVQLMSKYNAGELSQAEAEKVLAGRFGKAGVRQGVPVTIASAQ
jgi:Na+/melibiose symporter-like transporter